MSKRITIKELSDELTVFTNLLTELEETEKKINTAIDVISNSGFQTLSHTPLEKLIKLNGVIEEEKLSVENGKNALQVSVKTFESVDSQLSILMGEALEIQSDYVPSEQKVSIDLEENVGQVVCGGNAAGKTECVTYATARLVELGYTNFHGFRVDYGKNYCKKVSQLGYGTFIEIGSYEEIKTKVENMKTPAIFSNNIHDPKYPDRVYAKYGEYPQEPDPGHILVVEDIVIENGEAQLYFTEGNNGTKANGTLQKMSFKEFYKKRIEPSNDPKGFVELN